MAAPSTCETADQRAGALGLPSWSCAFDSRHPLSRLLSWSDSPNSVALGSVAPQLVGCAGGEVLGVDLDLGVDDAEGFLEVGDLLPHLRLVPAQDLEPLRLVAGALRHQLRVAADFGERHPRRAQLGAHL